MVKVTVARGFAQNVAAIITLLVVILLVLMAALGPVVFKKDIDFPPAAYALMAGVLYFIFGFRMAELNSIVGKLLSQAAKQATREMAHDAEVEDDSTAEESTEEEAS